MQTIKDAAPVEVIRAELYRLNAAELVEMVLAIGDLYDGKVIDHELHDYLLFQIMSVTDERVEKPAKVG